MNKIENIELPRRRLVIFEAILMALIFLAVFAVGRIVHVLLIKATGSAYIAFVIYIVLALFIAYRYSNGTSLEVRKRNIYTANIARLYDFLRFYQKKVPDETIIKIMEMRISMFHDSMKEGGRTFTPEIAKRLNLATRRFETAIRSSARS